MFSKIRGVIPRPRCDAISLRKGRDTISIHSISCIRNYPLFLPVNTCSFFRKFLRQNLRFASKEAISRFDGTNEFYSSSSSPPPLFSKTRGETMRSFRISPAFIESLNIARSRKRLLPRPRRAAPFLSCSVLSTERKNNVLCILGLKGKQSPLLLKRGREWRGGGGSAHV